MILRLRRGRAAFERNIIAVHRRELPILVAVLHTDIPADPVQPQRRFVGPGALEGFPIAAQLRGVLHTAAADLELSLQTRDPVSGQIRIATERVDPKHVGVIAVDVWNFHWCKTATMRVDASAEVQSARHGREDERVRGEIGQI